MPVAPALKPSLSSAEWQPIQAIQKDPSYLATLQKTSGPLSANIRQESGPTSAVGASSIQRASKRNYSALVAALQTLGYSVPGFVATAVVSLDGQPIAQVTVDDLDISLVCKHFSSILQGALLSLDQGGWGHYENTVITSVEHYTLLRIVGSEKDAFQVLITTREADPAESLEVMANVEGAIGSALQ